MDSVTIRKEDQILMSLVHYFVTKENYSPIYVQGVKDEIWLEKLDGPYRVIRINSNKIFNNEQFQYDQFRIKSILRQIRKKTMSFKVNALNINLNEDENVSLDSMKYVDSIAINNLEDVQNNKDIVEVFPNIKDNLYHAKDGLDLIFNVTKDINEKTERENKRYEQIFSNKKPVVTYAVMGLCALVFLISYIMYKGDLSAYNLIEMGANNQAYLRSSLSEIYRLITYAFLHSSIMHIMMNLYSLWVIGPQVENRFSSVRFLVIYMISAVTGGLLSAGINPSNIVSVGASGAIFGLLGAFVYFGFKFRLYLKDALLSRIVPVILLNLFMGFAVDGIDNACHIGGLIGGYLVAMAVGIPGAKNKRDNINGIILLIIFGVFLGYLTFIR